MSKHNEEKEVIEAALARAANYRGISLCTPAVTRVSDWLLSDDGSITGPKYTVECQPSAHVKALIDASFDAVTPPVDVPVDPTEPPINPVEPVDSVLPPVEGSHTVKATVIDGAGIEWTASATVNNDASVAGQLVNFKSADGVEHDGLQAMFYADCCHVSANRCDFPYDEAGCLLSVTYDGQPVNVPPSSYPDGTLTFWRGSRMPAIRYGAQVPFDASKIDWSILPDFANEPQEPISAKRQASFDWTFNGKGSASYSGMSATGERDDIGFLSGIDMAFITNPSQETWDLVRKTDDWSGNWRMAQPSDPITGKILKKTDYANVTLLTSIQGTYAGNPIAQYIGVRKGGVVTPKTSGWTRSICPNNPDTAHLTSYGMLAGMITGAANDLDTASFWGNYPMIETNPSFYRNRGMTDYQARGTAWGLRSIFIAAFYSSDKQYFKDEVDRNVSILNETFVDEFGVYGKGDGYVSPNGHRGTALWMQAYLSIVVGAVTKKFPALMPFVQKLATLETVWFSKPYALQRTIYAFMTEKPDGSRIDSFDERVKQSLIKEGYTEAEADATVNATMVQEAYDAHKAYHARKGTSWSGKIVNGVSDFRSGQTLDDSYPAGAIAAIYSAHNLGATGLEQAVYAMDNLPTKIDFRSNQQNHIIKKD